MSSEALDFGRLTPSAAGAGGQATGRPRPLVGYATALGLVGLAVLAAVIVRHLIAAPNVTLIFVLPVVIVATSFGFGPSLAAALLGVLAFDFFFAQPLYSLRIYSPSDLWAAALLLVIAAIVSTVAAEARRRAVEARREADRAGALHDLAHRVVAAAPSAEVAQATAQALARIFQAPAAVLVQQGDRLEASALTPGATLSPADLEAAGWTLANQTPSRAETFPFDTSTFDFWPIRREGAPGLVLGVRSGDRDARPEHPAQYVELAGAYLAASLTAPAHPR